jgi:hypothetical protein
MKDLDGPFELGRHVALGRFGVERELLALFLGACDGNQTGTGTPAQGNLDGNTIVG